MCEVSVHHRSQNIDISYVARRNVEQVLIQDDDVRVFANLQCANLVIHAQLPGRVSGLIGSSCEWLD